MKKIFITSASLFAVTLLFLGVYRIAFRNDPNDPTADEKRRKAVQEESKAGFESEQAEREAVETVSDGPVYGPAAVGGNMIAFFRDGALRSFSLGGGGEQVVISDLPGKLLDVRWAPDRHAALAFLGSGTTRRWHLVDLETDSVTALKDGMLSPSWSNLSERIFYFYRKPDEGLSVDTAKPDGSEWKAVGSVPALRDPVGQAVPNSTLFSFFGRPTAYETSALSVIPVTGGEARSIFDGKYGADFSWSPDGKKLLISNTVTSGGADVRLGLANQNGGEFHTLQVPTVVGKTVWSKDGRTVYYALPLSLPDDIAMPDDYASGSFMTSDSFWKLDTETGKSERIVPLENMAGDFDSTNLFLDENEDFLFFVNRRDDRLYRIGLR